MRVQKSRLLPSLLFRTLEKSLLFWTSEKNLLFWIPGKFYFFGPPICEFLKSLLFWTFRFEVENEKSTFLDVTSALDLKIVCFRLYPIRFRFWKTILIGFWKRTLLIGFHFWKKHFWSGSNVFFDPSSFFSKRNWAGSKVFSHASASRDYIGLLDQTLDPRVCD